MSRRKTNELLQKGPEPEEIPDTIEQSDPDYNYRMSKYFILSGFKMDPFGNSDVDRLIDYLLTWDTDDLPPAGALDLPHIHGAFKALYQPEKLTAIYTECGLLTGADAAEIGDFLGVPQKTVEAYEMSFFNVRPYLEKPGVLARTVFRPLAACLRDGGLPASRRVPLSMDDVWRFICYHTGWEQYTELVAYRDFEDVEDARTVIHNRSEGLKGIKAALDEAVTPNNIETILDRYAAKKERESTQEMPAGSTQTTIWDKMRGHFLLETQDMRDEGMSAHEPCNIAEHEKLMRETDDEDDQE